MCDEIERVYICVAELSIVGKMFYFMEVCRSLMKSHFIKKILINSMLKLIIVNMMHFYKKVKLAYCKYDVLFKKYEVRTF